MIYFIRDSYTNPESIINIIFPPKKNINYSQADASIHDKIRKFLTVEIIQEDNLKELALQGGVIDGLLVLNTGYVEVG